VTKYKIIGIITLFLGLIQLILVLSFLIFTVPRLIEIYRQFESQPNLTTVYTISALILTASFINLFLGVKNFQENKEKERYFNYSLISVIVTFFLGGILVSMLNLSALLPLYNLTSRF